MGLKLNHVSKRSPRPQCVMHTYYQSVFVICISVSPYINSLVEHIFSNGHIPHHYANYSNKFDVSIFVCMASSSQPLDMIQAGAFLLTFTHYGDIIMGTIVSQITSLVIVYSSVYSDADQRKHQSSASLAFVWGIHRGPVNSPHKWPVTRKMFPFDDVIMLSLLLHPFAILLKCKLLTSEICPLI